MALAEDQRQQRRVVNQVVGGIGSHPVCEGGERFCNFAQSHDVNELNSLSCRDHLDFNQHIRRD